MLPACYLSQAGPKLSCCFFILLRPLQPCRPRSRNRKGGRASRNKEWAESRKAEGGGEGGAGGGGKGRQVRQKYGNPGVGMENGHKKRVSPTVLDCREEDLR